MKPLLVWLLVKVGNAAMYIATRAYDYAEQSFYEQTEMQASVCSTRPLVALLLKLPLCGN